MERQGEDFAPVPDNKLLHEKQIEVVMIVRRHMVALEAKDNRLVAAVVVEQLVDHQIIQLLHKEGVVIKDSQVKEYRSEEVDQNCDFKCILILITSIHF